MPKKQSVRGNYMDKPEQGWAHNSAALSVGHGVYYSFPVRYVGSIQVMQSLTKISMEVKTAVCWEAIARCCDAAGLRKKKKRKVPKEVNAYLADAPYVKVMELKINLSVEGIATSDLSNNEIISNDDIKRISFAAGGNATEYDFITYVAKDKRDNRYCHVFDCSILADDVLATIGQIFNLLTNPEERQAELAKDAAVLGAIQKEGAAPVGNPLYDAMAAGDSGIASIRQSSVKNAPRGAGAPNPSYAGTDDGDGVYDNPEGEACYDEVGESGAALASFLNENAKDIGDQPLYGEIGEAEQEALYGDGAEPGWGYLDVKPDEDLYGGLADVFVDE